VTTVAATAVIRMILPRLRQQGNGGGISADALAMDGSGNLYITDNINRMIWRVTPDGSRTPLSIPFAGTPSTPWRRTRARRVLPGLC